MLLFEKNRGWRRCGSVEPRDGVCLPRTHGRSLRMARHLSRLWEVCQREKHRVPSSSGGQIPNKYRLSGVQGAVKTEPGGAGRDGELRYAGCSDEALWGGGTGAGWRMVSGSIRAGGGPSKCGAPGPSAGGRSGKAGRGPERSERAGGCGPRRAWGTWISSPSGRAKSEHREWPCDFHCSGSYGNSTCRSIVAQMGVVSLPLTPSPPK